MNTHVIYGSVKGAKLAQPANAADRSGTGGDVRAGVAGVPRVSAGAFNLGRRFALVSVVVIFAVGIATSAVLSRFLATEMLQRDAEVTAQFLRQSSIQKHAESYFLRNGEQAQLDREVESYSAAIMGMADLMRAHIYSYSGRILWSSDARAIQHTFARNPDLERAVAGETVAHIEEPEHLDLSKPEHRFANLSGQQFAEYYIPVRDAAGGRVIGVVELYKKPDSLFASIRAGQQLIWLCTLGGGLLIYGVLFWLVRSGDRVIRDQQRRIASSERYAAIGEVTAAVAHNIRNPLATIRSSAELMSGESRDATLAMSRDIVDQVDRLEGWIRGLLDHARAGSGAADSIDANELLRRSVDGMREEVSRRRVAVRWSLQAMQPRVRVDAATLESVVKAITVSALAQMPDGGTLTVATRGIWQGRSGSRIEISISDTGAGLSAESSYTSPNVPPSSKPHGMGVGLPIMARTLKRMGGAIGVHSMPGCGTSVTLTLPGVEEVTAP